jgi:microcystin-dependent protein
VLAEPFLSEMRIMAFGFPPRGWAQCDGATLQINQNQALFALLGTMYGGDGRTTFGLPDMRGRTPLHRGASQGGSSYIQGQKGGEASQTLNAAEIPLHTHPVRASTTRSTATPRTDG